MSIEEKIRELARSTQGYGPNARAGMTVNETTLHREIEAIWSALLFVGQELDARSEPVS